MKNQKKIISLLINLVLIAALMSLSTMMVSTQQSKTATPIKIFVLCLMPIKTKRLTIWKKKRSISLENAKTRKITFTPTQT